jgi:Zn-dependent protease
VSERDTTPPDPYTAQDWERLYEASQEDDLRGYRPIQPEPAWRAFLRRLWAPIAVVLGLVVKFGAALFKFFGIFISVAGYALIWGWTFGIGFVVMILVHEMGHFIEARRQGLHPALPVFVPFLGAYVAIKDAPDDPWHNGLISLAGPFFGGAAAAASWGLGVWLESDLLQALGYTGFLLNLFNLLPVWMLDGGFTWRAVKALRGRRERTWLLTLYIGLAAALAAGMWLAHLPQDRL